MVSANKLSVPKSSMSQFFIYFGVGYNKASLDYLWELSSFMGQVMQFS
jgi:hypothetical protein